KTEQHLQKAMQVGGGVEVAPARDVAHALPGVVDYDGQMVARRGVLAYDDRIAPALGPCLDRLRPAVLVEFDEAKRGGCQFQRSGADRCRHVEAQRVRLPCSTTARDFGGGPGPVEARGGRRGVGVRAAAWRGEP